MLNYLRKKREVQIFLAHEQIFINSSKWKQDFLDPVCPFCMSSPIKERDDS